FVLLGAKQMGNLTLNRFGAKSQELSRLGCWAGDIEYDPALKRILYGSHGISMASVNAKRIVSDQLVETEGGSYEEHNVKHVVLSSDRKYFYYGEEQLDAMDLSKRRLKFPERILAASHQLAFGAKKFYDVSTGQPAGEFGYEAAAYGMAEDGRLVWVIDSKWT